MSAVPSDLCHFSHSNDCNSFSRYHASLADAEERKKESQKIDDLPILATYQTGTLATFSSEVNGPIARGSTLVMPDMAHGAL